MNDEQYSPDEQRLIRRLENAPQADLDLAAFEAIRARMLAALDTPPVPAPSSPALPPLIALVIVVVGIVGVVILIGRPQPTETIMPTPTLALTAIPPSATASPTQLPTATRTPTSLPTATAIATNTPDATATPESTAPPVLIIEGPVESIEGNIIVIYGITIELRPDDPLLTVIQVGDVIRVEGDQINAGSGVISGGQVDFATVEVNVNPTTNEVWRDDGTCSHPPPDWAPANGWRRRCQGAPKPGGGPDQPPGQGQGKESRDDDGKDKDKDKDKDDDD